MLKAQRLSELTGAVFAQMEDARRRCVARGMKVINLSVGSPDLAPAPHVIQTLRDGIEDLGNYGYPMKDMPEFRQAVAGWYRRRFVVELKPETEVLGLMGSQEGLAHICLGVVDPGEIVMVPDPGYPIYSAGPLMAGAVLYPLPMVAENDFLPDLDSIPGEVWRKTRVLVLNYPNNPVSAVAGRDFFEHVVDVARRRKIIVVHDAAYSELAFDGYRPMSFLEVPGAREVGVEFNSCSKTFNMAGCRVAYLVGNPEVVAALAEVKAHLDYGIFRPVQQAAIAALDGPQDVVREMALTYQRRRDVLIDGLNRAGWSMPKPKATMFAWAPVPRGYGSQDFAMTLLERAGVAVVPGNGFGARGEGYVRIALVQPEEVMREVVDRVAQSGVLEAPILPWLAP